MVARFIVSATIAAGLSAAILGQVAAQAKVRTNPTGDVARVQRQAELQAALSNWPEKGRAAVQRMIATCGQPQEISETAIVWTVTDGRARCNPAAAGIPPEDSDAYNLGRIDPTN